MNQKEILSRMDPRYSAFGMLFQLSNQLETLSNTYLDTLTTKQWFLLIVIKTFFIEPPSVSEAAQIFGSSHQNVKQVALKLQEKGFLQIKKDPKDNRVSRLVLTDQVDTYLGAQEEKSAQFMNQIFQGFTSKEAKQFFQLFIRLSENAREIASKTKPETNFKQEDSSHA